MQKIIRSLIPSSFFLTSAVCLLPSAWLTRFLLDHQKLTRAIIWSQNRLVLGSGLSCSRAATIIGQNNSGKTALLEALTLKLTSNPHRSTKTLPSSFSKIDELSRAKIILGIKRYELRKMLEQIPPPLGIFPRDYEHWSGEAAIVERIGNRFQEWFDETTPLELSLDISSDLQTEIKEEISGLFDDNFFGDENKKYSYIKISLGKDGTIDVNLKYEYIIDDQEYGYANNELVDYESFEGSYKESIAYKVFDLFRNRIYRFYAERLNITNCPYNGNYELKPDASNLAEVIHLLSSKNPSKFSSLNQFIANIFPHIAYISSREKDDKTVEIRVWTADAIRNDREDLTLPLSACGTGISQALAILYVVVTSQFPRTIIIDEPQSFLHPGAAKKLIEILKKFPQHQYFIATHSPMLITAANPSRIIKLVYDGCETKASIISTEEIAEQRSILAEVGVRLSDVFGADNILWVEGQTEEQCFPLIIEKVAKKTLNGTVILRVQTTGHLEGKNASLIFDIYDRLSSGKKLFPPAIGFLLDREGKTEKQMKDFKRRSSNSIDFLPRRMYENYLLLPEAITSVINNNDEFRETQLTNIEVQRWIDQKRQEGKYLKRSNSENIEESEWIKKVDAAKLLKDLFSEFSEARVQFSKPKHPYELTAWIVENKPKYLSDLAKFLEVRLGNN